MRNRRVVLLAKSFALFCHDQRAQPAAREPDGERERARERDSEVMDLGEDETVNYAPVLPRLFRPEVAARRPVDGDS